LNFVISISHFKALSGHQNNSTPCWSGPGIKEERKIIDLEASEETEEIEEEEEPRSAT
jgi:hypothetical protein